MPAPPRVADLVIPIVMESASPTSTSEAPPPYPVISFLRSLGPTLSSLSEMNVTETEKSQPRRTLNHRKRSKPVPPPEQLIEPFGRSGSDILGNPSLTPKVDDRNSGQEKGEESDHQRVDTFMQRPTCSLSLLCYSRGYEMSKVRVASREIYNAESKFRQALVKQPDLCTTDKELFIRLKAVYNKELCGFWRRWFSLKSLRSLRLLSYTATSRPTPVPLDEFTMAEVLWAYNHPCSFSADDRDWIEWVFRLRQPSKRHALEFVEGWDSTRIAIVGTIPCIASTTVGIAWSVVGGDVQAAYTVAGFILTLCTVLLALLAVISGIDSKAS